MKRFVVVGNPIAQSKSPQIHQHFAEQFEIDLQYERHCLDEIHFKDQMQALFDDGVVGANVTMPFKHQAYDMASKHTERAIKAGAANTLYFENGELVADTTDGCGVVVSIEQLQNYELANKKVLVLGAGGAVRGIIDDLLNADVTSVTIANRTVQKAQDIAQRFDRTNAISLADVTPGFDVVINGTSSSLSGTALPITAEQLAGTQLVMDMTYAAQPTPFMQLAISQNIDAIDGLGMLVGQAAESFYIWHGKRPDVQSCVTSIARMLR